MPHEHSRQRLDRDRLGLCLPLNALMVTASPIHSGAGGSRVSRERMSPEGSERLRYSIQISGYLLTFSPPGLKFHVCETDKESVVFIFLAKISSPYPRPALVPASHGALSSQGCLRQAVPETVAASVVPYLGDREWSLHFIPKTLTCLSPHISLSL